MKFVSISLYGRNLQHEILRFYTCINRAFQIKIMFNVKHCQEKDECIFTSLCKNNDLLAMKNRIHMKNLILIL